MGDKGYNSEQLTQFENDYSGIMKTAPENDTAFKELFQREGIDQTKKTFLRKMDESKARVEEIEKIISEVKSDASRGATAMTEATRRRTMEMRQRALGPRDGRPGYGERGEQNVRELLHGTSGFHLGSSGEAVVYPADQSSPSREAAVYPTGQSSINSGSWYMGSRPPPSPRGAQALPLYRKWDNDIEVENIDGGGYKPPNSKYQKTKKNRKEKRKHKQTNKKQKKNKKNIILTKTSKIYSKSRKNNKKIVKHKSSLHNIR